MKLDSLARLQVRGFRSYRAMGTTGYLVAAALTFALHRAAHASLLDAILVTLAAPISFLVAVKLSYIVFGHERIVFYEKALAALGASALALHIADRPLAPGLDLTMVGLGVFLSFGRMGCLMVGCCYGRPARRGICYGADHVTAGFPARLSGVRLFPIQLADSALSLALVVAAVVLIVLPHAPGTPTVLWLEGYGVGRFALELARGDEARPRMRGLTEAQWTAILVAWAIVWLHGLTPITIAFASALTASGVAVIAVGTRWSPMGLTSPWHAAELARVLAALRRQPDGETRVTSLGVKASIHRLPGMIDFVISNIPQPALERLLPQLGLPSPDVKPGRTPGLFHLLSPG